MSLYECPIGHVATSPGTCYERACFRKRREVTKASTAAKERQREASLSIANLEAWAALRKGKGFRKAL